MRGTSGTLVLRGRRSTLNNQWFQGGQAPAPSVLQRLKLRGGHFEAWDAAEPIIGVRRTADAVFDGEKRVAGSWEVPLDRGSDACYGDDMRGVFRQEQGAEGGNAAGAGLIGCRSYAPLWGTAPAAL